MAWSSHVHVSMNAWACVVFGADVVIYLVVIAFGVERRVNITKIDRLVANKLPHHIKIVTVKEFVHRENSSGLRPPNAQTELPPTGQT